MRPRRFRSTRNDRRSASERSSRGGRRADRARAATRREDPLDVLRQLDKDVGAVVKQLEKDLAPLCAPLQLQRLRKQYEKQLEKHLGPYLNAFLNTLEDAAAMDAMVKAITNHGVRVIRDLGALLTLSRGDFEKQLTIAANQIGNSLTRELRQQLATLLPGFPSVVRIQAASPCVAIILRILILILIAIGRWILGILVKWALRWLIRYFPRIGREILRRLTPGLRRAIMNEIRKLFGLPPRPIP